MNKLQTPSEQLRAWRAYCRLTTAQTAQYSGVPEHMIIAIEQGRVYPDHITVDRLNAFFSQFHNRQTQQVTHQYYPQGQSYPPPAQTQVYSQQAHPQQPVYLQQTQVYSQQPQAQYPQFIQGYPQQAVAKTRRIRQKQARSTSTASSAGATLFFKILQIIVFAIPFIFLFFPFVNLAGQSALGDFGFFSELFNVNGHGLFVTPYLFHVSFSVLIIQIGLWITVFTGGAMIVFSILRFWFDEKLSPVRSILFYIYILGAVACLIGLITAGHSVRWGLIVYTVAVFVAAITRVFTDGGLRSFRILRR